MKAIVGVFLFFVSSIVFSASFQEGSNSFDKGDYGAAFKQWFPLAVSGDSRAQVSLGYMYIMGLGIMQSDGEAAKWYSKAATKGDINAQNVLATLYFAGRGVEKNQKTAIDWYLKAASQGSADAQHSLGSIYGNGEGVTQDNSLKVHWYTQAAIQGHAKSQYEIGAMYASGYILEKNTELALHWLRRSAKQGNRAAKMALREFKNDNEVDLSVIQSAITLYYNDKSVLAGKFKISNVEKIRIEGSGLSITAHMQYEYVPLPGNARESGYDQRIFLLQKHSGKYAVKYMGEYMSGHF